MTLERRAKLREGARYGGLITQTELEWLLDAADERDAYKHAHAVEEQAVEDVTRERDALQAEVERLREDVASLRQQVRHCHGPCADLTLGGAR